ncbi:MAG: hypothetical protein ABL949_14250 [Fimbriimonadaceae bacterium]
MKITLVGKVAILLILIGLGVGGWKLLGSPTGSASGSVKQGDQPSGGDNSMPTGNRQTITVLASSTTPRSCKV